MTKARPRRCGVCAGQRGDASTAPDRALLQTVNRGEFKLNGFRNRDLRARLYQATADAGEAQRQAAKVTRQLALPRAHGLIKKVPRTHRNVLTETGS